MASAQWTAQFASPIPSPLLHSLLLILLNSMATTVNYLTTTVLLPSSVLLLLFVATPGMTLEFNLDLPQYNVPMESTTQPTTTPVPAPEKCYKCMLNQLRLSPNKTSTFYSPKADLANRESLTNREICPHIIVTCRDNADNDKDTVTMQFNNGQGKPSTNTVLLKCNANQQWEYQPASGDQPKQEVTEISCKGDWKS